MSHLRVNERIVLLLLTAADVLGQDALSQCEPEPGFVGKAQLAVFETLGRIDQDVPPIDLAQACSRAAKFPRVAANWAEAAIDTGPLGL